MANFGKILGGGLGWAFGGPLGALIGVAAGEIFVDSKVRQSVQQQESGSGRQRFYRTTSGDFGAALMALSAVVIRADGKILKSEIKFVRKFFAEHFGTQKSNEYVRLLQELLKQDIPVRQICQQIRMNMQHPLRLELLHYLFEISNADGHVDQSEIDQIHKIATYLGISEKDYLSLKNMFFQDTDAAYKILEIDKSASDAEIKKAYRKMAVKYHPDKVSDLGPEFQENAKEKFQRVQDAYEKIKKERNIK